MMYLKSDGETKHSKGLQMTILIIDRYKYRFKAKLKSGKSMKIVNS